MGCTQSHDTGREGGGKASRRRSRKSGRKSMKSSQRGNSVDHNALAPAADASARSRHRKTSAMETPDRSADFIAINDPPTNSSRKASEVQPIVTATKATPPAKPAEAQPADLLTLEPQPSMSRRSRKIEPLPEKDKLFSTIQPQGSEAALSDISDATFAPSEIAKDAINPLDVSNMAASASSNTTNTINTPRRQRPKRPPSYLARMQAAKPTPVIPPPRREGMSSAKLARIQQWVDFSDNGTTPLGFLVDPADTVAQEARERRMQDLVDQGVPLFAQTVVTLVGGDRSGSSRDSSVGTGKGARKVTASLAIAHSAAPSIGAVDRLLTLL